MSLRRRKRRAHKKTGLFLRRARYQAYFWVPSIPFESSAALSTPPSERLEPSWVVGVNLVAADTQQ